MRTASRPIYLHGQLSSLGHSFLVPQHTLANILIYSNNHGVHNFSSQRANSASIAL